MFLIVLLAGLLPLEDFASVSTDHADECEINRYYDYQGRVCIHQLIWWDWYTDGTRRVVDWRMAKGKAILNVGPGCVVVWHENDRIRRVYSKVLTRSWTQDHNGGDLEIRDREYLPQKFRRGLAK